MRSNSSVSPRSAVYLCNCYCSLIVMRGLYQLHRVCVPFGTMRCSCYLFRLYELLIACNHERIRDVPFTEHCEIGEAQYNQTVVMVVYSFVEQNAKATDLEWWHRNHVTVCVCISLRHAHRISIRYDQSQKVNKQTNNYTHTAKQLAVRRQHFKRDERKKHCQPTYTKQDKWQMDFP